MGSLAGPKLRQLRYAAHQEFNKLYQSGLMTKREAYQWLAMTVQAPMAHAHIGHLGEYYCQVVIDESRKLLQERLEGQKSLGKVSGEKSGLKKGKCLSFPSSVNLSSSL